MGEIFGGRYELLEPIADGGMGSVWRALDHRDGTTKAAKLLRQADAGSLLRFIREQGTRIHHPHVVTPLSWAGEDDRVLFTMPLVRGGSVATLLGDHGALPEQWVAVLLTQTLSGLDAVHAAGIIHRDVKPANLLLEPTGSALPHVRLTDFGIAVAVDEPRLTRGPVTLGTPGYLAPDQDQGAEPDLRQDLYAVGVTGLQMLTGLRPPHRPDDLPDTPLARVLATAADPDPARRPASASELARLVQAVTPEGTWDPGDVEVLDHFGVEPSTATSAAVPAPPPGPPPPPPRQAGTREETKSRPVAPPTAPPARPYDDRPVWPIVVLLLSGLLLLAGGIWLLS